MLLHLISSGARTRCDKAALARTRCKLFAHSGSTQSIRDYTKVLEIDPNHVNAAYGRAACHNMNGNFQLVRGHAPSVRAWRYAAQSLRLRRCQANRDYDMALRKDKAKMAQSPHPHRSPSMQRKGSFALGVEEYVKQTEKKARSKVESKLRSTRMARVYGDGSAPPSTPTGLRVSTRTGTPSSAIHGKPTAARPPTAPPQARGAGSGGAGSGGAGSGSPAGAGAGGKGAISEQATSGASATLPSVAPVPASKPRSRPSPADGHHARGFALRKKGVWHCAQPVGTWPGLSHLCLACQAISKARLLPTHKPSSLIQTTSRHTSTVVSHTTS